MACPAMESAAATALRSVLSRVHVAAERSGRSSEQVRIVAVSKTKSVSVIQQAYEAGHRVFGENYVQELVEKCPQVHAVCVCDAARGIELCDKPFHSIDGIPSVFL